LAHAAVVHAQPLRRLARCQARRATSIARATSSSEARTPWLSRTWWTAPTFLPVSLGSVRFYRISESEARARLVPQSAWGAQGGFPGRARGLRLLPLRHAPGPPRGREAPPTG
jgi:hypothetical protein